MPQSRLPVLGPKHPRIVELRRLIGRRSSRSAEVLLEGPRTIADAIAAGHEPITVVVPESAVDDVGVTAVSASLTERCEVLVVRDPVFERLAPSVSPQPMLAVVARPQGVLPDVLGPTDVALVLVEVADPGNVGTLVRVADAVGAVAVVWVGGADPWAPKAVRASAGSILRLPVVAHDSLADAAACLRAAGARTVGTDVRAGEPYDGGVLVPPVAIVLGSEAHGLDRSHAASIDAWATIEMAGNAESLNVAMAGTLLAHEASRPHRP